MWPAKFKHILYPVKQRIVDEKNGYKIDIRTRKTSYVYYTWAKLYIFGCLYCIEKELTYDFKTQLTS